MQVLSSSFCGPVLEPFATLRDGARLAVTCRATRHLGVLFPRQPSWQEIINTFPRWYVVTTHDEHMTKRLYFHRHKDGKSNLCIVLGEHDIRVFLSEAWQENAHDDTIVEFDISQTFDRARLKAANIHSVIDAFLADMFPRAEQMMLQSEQVPKRLKTKLQYDRFWRPMAICS
jgi:hypothetical protein